MFPPAGDATPSPELRVWALIGPKHGDNAQVRALVAAIAARVAARVEERALSFHGAELLVHAWPGPTRCGLARGAGRDLRAPWPDLVISAGRRNEPVARWIRQRSAGHTRLVHLGRPWAAPRHFDLVIANSQYQVPVGAGVLECVLPLTAPGTGSVGPAAPELVPAIATLPRPWTAVLIGGDSGFLLFDAARARVLAERLERSHAETGGTLVLVGSPRTPPAFLDALDASLAAPHYLHRWAAGQDNPYRALLAQADTLIVTSDSVSMVVEAGVAGRPVYLFDVQPRASGWWRHPGEYRWRALSHRFVQGFAPRRFRRDIRRIHERLVAQGAVRWLDDAARPYVPSPLDPAAELERAVRRVLELFGDH